MSSAEAYAFLVGSPLYPISDDTSHLPSILTHVRRSISLLALAQRACACLLHRDIIRDIRTRKRLQRLKRLLAELRHRSGNIRSRELVSLARALGRVLYDRGKEPTYVSTLLPNSRPISIPNHPGALNRFTAGNILDQLEQDIFSLEDMLTSEEGSTRS